MLLKNKLRHFVGAFFVLLISLLPNITFAIPAPPIPAPDLKFISGQGNWSVANTKFTTSGDYNGDGLKEVAAIYDYGNKRMGIWTFDQYLPLPLQENGVKPLETGDLQAHLRLLTAQGSWNLALTKFVVSGDYNADNYDDIAMMYNYGNNTMGIWIFLSNGSAFTPVQAYLGNAGAWNTNNTKFFVNGDINGDTRDDMYAMYDYGNNNMGIWVFDSGAIALQTSDSTRKALPVAITPFLIYQTGPGSWNVGATRFLNAGDYDNDGVEELSAVYDYGNNNMGIWKFDLPQGPQLPDKKAIFKHLNLLQLTLMYQTGPGSWNVGSTKFVSSGDYDGDSIADLGLVYDYGNNTMGIWFFKSNGTTFTPSMWFNSGRGNWSVANSKFTTSGLISLDPFSDIAIVYDYGLNNMGIWVFSYTNAPPPPLN